MTYKLDTIYGCLIYENYFNNFISSLNCMVIKRNAVVLDTMHKMGSEKLGYNVPKVILFLVLLTYAVFIFGIKKIDYSEQSELERKINEVIEESR